MSTFFSSIAFCRRPRLSSTKSFAKMLLKPRFGMRMWSGIWPPSKPYTFVPVRALAPFTPRPDVLPRPDDEPRPTFDLRLCAPGLLRSSLSFMSFAFFNYLYEVPDCENHSANGRRVFERARAADLSQAQPAQSRCLNIGLAIGASNLAHGHCLPGFLLRHGSFPYEADACSPFWPSRRAMISVTLRPRR